MKFTVARDVLSEAVSWTARAVPNRPASPILAGVRMSAADDVLTLSSFDYEVSANSEVAATVEEPGEVLVSGRLLADISKSFPNRPVRVELDGQKVSLTCGSSHFTLAVMSLDEYPLLPAQPEARGRVDAAVLAQAVHQVSVAASRDDTLPLLTAVRMEIEGSKMTLLATDRYRLAVRELSWEPSDEAYSEAALVKARILQDVAKSMTSGGAVELGVSHEAKMGTSSLIGFAAGGRRTTSGEDAVGGAVVRTRLIHGEREHVIELEIVRGKANRARLNRTQTRPRDIVGMVKTVVFAPEDLSLIRGEPGVRRTFLDELTIQRKPLMVQIKADFDKVAKQRAALMKQAQARLRRGHSPDLSTIDIWDENFARLSARITAERAALVREMADPAHRAYDKVADSPKQLTVRLDASIDTVLLPQSGGGSGVDEHRPS